jgi:acyl carrier protein
MPKLNIATKADIREQVYDIITDTAIINRKDIADNKRFLYDLDMDSLDYLNIILECEKVFNISINDMEIEQTLTVDDLIKLIEQKNPTQWRVTQKQSRLQEFMNKLKKAKKNISNKNNMQHTK